jgi:hypothetical protein
MSHYFGLDWLAMCFTFIAIYLLGNKNRIGFALMMSDNLCWAVIGLWAGSYLDDHRRPRLLRHERARLSQVANAAGAWAERRRCARGWRRIACRRLPLRRHHLRAPTPRPAAAVAWARGMPLGSTAGV